MDRVELRGSGPEIPAADNVVALEHGPGLVPAQLHGDALGHAGTHEVPDGRPAEVVAECDPGTRPLDTPP